MAVDVTAIIPARGGSKRLPKKNLALLCGKPLLQYTIDAGLQSQSVRRVIVSTDDPEIARLSTDLGAHSVLIRPAELATDTATTSEVLVHIARELATSSSPPEVLVLLQPTSPMRRAAHVDEAVDLLFRLSADTVTAVRLVSDHPYFMWRREGECIHPLFSLEHQEPGRVVLPEYFIENGSILVVRRLSLLRHGLYGPRTVPYVMDAVSSVDIDEATDLAWATFLLTGQPG